MVVCTLVMQKPDVNLKLLSKKILFIEKKVKYIQVTHPMGQHYIFW
jgi:hypothetical protein